MELTELRNEIDGIDRELVRLLEARMDVASDIAAYKLAHGKPVLDAEREQAKLDWVRAQCRPDTAEHIAAVFDGIMAASRAYQERRMKENGHGG